MDFTNIDELYSFIEETTKGSGRQWDFTKDFRRLADATLDEKIKEKIKWESFVFDFNLDSGKVKPTLSGTKEDGSIFGYPSYLDFGENGLNYLIGRATEVKNDYLIARYNQILWNSPSKYKHQQQARKAINGYLRLLKNFDGSKKERKEDDDRLRMFKNGFGLAVQVKYRINEYKSLIKTWLFERGRYKPELKIYLLQYMLEMSQFKKQDFNGSLELVRKLGGSRGDTPPDLFLKKEIHNTGLRIAQRVGSDSKIWNKRIGDTIVKMAEQRMDDETRMIPLSLYKDAITYYKATGFDKRVKEIENRYFELKKELKLSKVEIPLPEKESELLSNYLNAQSQKLLEYSPEQIFTYFATSDDIFPKKVFIKERVKNQQDSFLDSITTIKFDINKNVSKEKNGIVEKENTNLYKSYHFYIIMSVVPLLHRIFIDGIRNGKLSYENLVKFIFEKTWLGQVISDFDLSGEPIQYRWISLIAPSFHEYFLQSEGALKSNNPNTNYVMPIDSLTLKFEGVLRDFAKIIGVPTTTSGKGNVLREKYIEELLAEEDIQKFFDENDLLFFNYLFVAKDGMNLRNNIAHSFFRFNNYSFHLMHLLICAFLRIGKYKLQKK
jgi:hypothetical protein